MESEIPAYLKFYDNYYMGGEKVNHIIVEGPSDVNFLCNFLNNKIMLDGSERDLSIPKERILENFLISADIMKNNHKRLFSQNVPLVYKDINLFYRYYSIPKHFRKGESKYNCYDFVKYTISEFCRNKDIKYKNINCFGISDYDFGQHNIENEIDNNMTFTEMHDRETTLFRYSLPTFVNMILDEDTKNIIINFIIDAIILSYKQGKCEKYFWNNIFSMDFNSVLTESYEKDTILDSVQKDYLKYDKAIDLSHVSKWLMNIKPLNANEEDTINKLFYKIDGSYLFEELPLELKKIIISKDGYAELESIPVSCCDYNIHDRDSLVYRNKLPVYYNECYSLDPIRKLNDVLNAIEILYKCGIIEDLIWNKYNSFISHRKFKENNAKEFVDLDKIIDEIDKDVSLKKTVDGWLRGKTEDTEIIDTIFLTINSHELIDNLNKGGAFRDFIINNQPDPKLCRINRSTTDDDFIMYYLSTGILNANYINETKKVIDVLYGYKPFDKYISYLKKNKFF